MDKERILSKIDDIDGYLSELEGIIPGSFEEYKNSIRDKRACERLLQIAIESVIDACNLFVSDLKLGIPSDEDDIIKKLEKKKIISGKMAETIRDMKGFRNILVHKYGVLKDELVFEMLSEKLEDFEKFKKEILKKL